MRKVLKMAKSKLEYIWLDGYHPTQSLRSKTRIVEDFSGDVADAPIWSFDGSSTEQATGDSSDCLLKPVAAYPDPDRLGGNGWLIMTEVLNADGTPHESNGRATIDDDDAVTAAESDDHGAARGGGAETERERENVGESVDVTKRMTMGACVACSESL